jgi:tetraacyldisaccharide 4'-kinase
MAVYISRLLKDEGLKVVVLSRGYKRKSGGMVVVSDEKGILAVPEDSGDEPYLIAKKLPATPVIVSSDRVRAGLYACRRFSPDVVVLDDGFQHIRLERDLDIALLNGPSPFGNGRLIPAGPLRENVKGLERADIVMIKGGRRGLGAPFSGPVFDFFYRPAGLLDLNLERTNESLEGRSVHAFAGIADPEGFFETVKTLGARLVKETAFADHHWYGKKEIEGIENASAGAELLVTTEKDAVRLKPGWFRMPVRVVSVEVETEENFRGLLKSKVPVGARP